MAIINRKIVGADYNGKDIAGLPDNPTSSGMSASQIKARFDSLMKNLSAVNFNALIDDLIASTGASEIGFTAITDVNATNVQQAIVLLKAYMETSSTIKAVNVTTLETETATVSVLREADGLTFTFGIPKGAKGNTGASITSASFVSNDMVFTKDDATTVTLPNAKNTLKGNQWRGAYSSDTAYVVDDVVSYLGSSYICILASTNNLPTNATYWSLFATANEFKMNHLYVSPSYTSAEDGFNVTKFNTLFEANASITTNSKTNRFTIIVAQGTYTDLQTRYAGIAGSSYQGINTKDYVYYESEDIDRPDLCVINWDGATGFTGTITEEMLVYKCPFHVIGYVSGTKSGMHTHIKGFTFNCVNTRYALHIETEGQGVDVDWVVENCVFNWGGRPDATTGGTTQACIGMGNSPFEKGLIKNCIITNTIGSEGIQNHNNPHSANYTDTPFLYQGFDITIEGCDLGGKNIQFRTWVNIANSTFDMLYLKNCVNINRAYNSLISPATVNNNRSVVEGCEITTDELEREFTSYKTSNDLLVNAKADKVQEAWINPTLVNSWVVAGGLTVSYFKDQFGIVRFKGNLIGGGVGTVAFVLPVGYRPVQNQRIVILTSGYGIAQAFVEMNGNVQIFYPGTPTFISLDNASFKVA